ncbi:unnamed protein product [Polarella glacialis]|uniref:RRM domain-containing protein n=1 Tax=Polarella glacialis TaxID=89957 RepID=A0A813L779_POLGL|nr:unnamed protein product [Polarella glacialis]
MGKNKKAFVSDAGGNKIVHPADFQRKKAKTKLIEKRKKDRKENYEASMLTKAPELIENEIREYKEMEAAGKLTKWKKDRMSREIAFYDRLKDQVGENQQKRDERNKNNSLHVDFDELKIHRKASIYYDPVKNPYGAPPTGQMLMYRHPDGSIKRNPPAESSTAASGSRGLVPGHADMALPGTVDNAAAAAAAGMSDDEDGSSGSEEGSDEVKYLVAEEYVMTQLAEDREGEKISQGWPLFGMGSTEGQNTKVYREGERRLVGQLLVKVNQGSAGERGGSDSSSVGASTDRMNSLELRIEEISRRLSHGEDGEAFVKSTAKGGKKEVAEVSEEDHSGMPNYRSDGRKAGKERKATSQGRSATMQEGGLEPKRAGNPESCEEVWRSYQPRLPHYAGGGRHAAAGPNSTAPGPEVVILVFSCKLGRLSGYSDQGTQGRMEEDWLWLQWFGEATSPGSHTMLAAEGLCIPAEEREEGEMIVGEFDVIPQSGYPYLRTWCCAKWWRLKRQITIWPPNDHLAAKWTFSRHSCARHKNVITNELLRHAAAGPNSTAPGPEVVILVFSCKLGQLSGYSDQRTQGRMEEDWLRDFGVIKAFAGIRRKVVLTEQAEVTAVLTRYFHGRNGGSNLSVTSDTSIFTEVQAAPYDGTEDLAEVEVGNLPNGVTEQQLFRYFGRAGKVVSVSLGPQRLPPEFSEP